MSMLYSESHRALRDAFDRRKLADFLEKTIVHAEVAPDEKEFIERQDMFFHATVDPNGQPTLSYKGGAAGFVRVLDPKTIAFPLYDGNGMFYSAGNIDAVPRVGLLFIDFAVPHRLRVQGEARISRDKALVATWPGALLAVRVMPTAIFANCGRYMHKRTETEPSRYVPDRDGHAPLPAWKHIDVVQDALNPEERKCVAEAGGPIGRSEYAARIAAGQP